MRELQLAHHGLSDDERVEIPLPPRVGRANVFFATVLFLAGIATLLQKTRIQVGILVLGVVMLVAGGAIIVSTPDWSSIGG